MTTTDAPASFAVHIPDAALEPEPLDPDQIVSGDPAVTGKVLWSRRTADRPAASGRSPPEW